MEHVNTYITMFPGVAYFAGSDTIQVPPPPIDGLVRLVRTVRLVCSAHLVRLVRLQTDNFR
jgi:hypothetical protein